MHSKGDRLDVPKALLMVLGSDTSCLDYTVDVNCTYRKKGEAIKNVNKKDICIYAVSTFWKAHRSALVNI